jgi:ribulose-bisphosphate carboxylase large chain
MVDYINLDYSPHENDLVAMYYIERAPESCPSLEKACEEVAKESSIGTWTEISTMSKDIAKNLRPSVYSIDEDNHIAKIAYT